MYLLLLHLRSRDMVYEQHLCLYIYIYSFIHNVDSVDQKTSTETQSLKSILHQQGSEKHSDPETARDDPSLQTKRGR